MSEMKQGSGGVGYRPGETDNRPWGSWKVLETGPGFAVKRILVTPGGQLSLQRHQHRAEHWICVAGTARVTCDDKVFDMPAGQATYLPKSCVHRLENLTSEIVEIVEIQMGDILEETDIERLVDVYGRS